MVNVEKKLQIGKRSDFENKKLKHPHGPHEIIEYTFNLIVFIFL